MARTPGARNKRTRDYESIYEREIKRSKFCPIRTLTEIASNPEMEPQHRIAATSTLMSYRFAKLKAIETQATGGPPTIALTFLPPEPLPLAPAYTPEDLASLGVDAATAAATQDAADAAAIAKRRQ